MKFHSLYTKYMVFSTKFILNNSALFSGVENFKFLYAEAGGEVGNN